MAQQSKEAPGQNRGGGADRWQSAQKSGVCPGEWKTFLVKNSGLYPDGEVPSSVIWATWGRRSWDSSRHETEGAWVRWSGIGGGGGSHFHKYQQTTSNHGRADELWGWTWPECNRLLWESSGKKCLNSSLLGPRKTWIRQNQGLTCHRIPKRIPANTWAWAFSKR